MLNPKFIGPIMDLTRVNENIAVMSDLYAEIISDTNNISQDVVFKCIQFHMLNKGFIESKYCDEYLLLSPYLKRWISHYFFFKQDIFNSNVYDIKERTEFLYDQYVMKSSKKDGKEISSNCHKEVGKMICHAFEVRNKSWSISSEEYNFVDKIIGFGKDKFDVRADEGWLKIPSHTMEKFLYYFFYDENISGTMLPAFFRDYDYLHFKKRLLSSDEFVYGEREFIDIECLKNGQVVHTTHVTISFQTYDVRIGFFTKVLTLLKFLDKK